jgi:hypothetical protein
MLVIGGISVTSEQAQVALEILRSSQGMMIRQPLARAGHPLAACDYHAAAAPFRARAQDVPSAGRGAAGRHLAKPAFIIAVESALALDRQAAQQYAELEHAVASLHPRVPPEQVGRALAAFAVDSSYVTLMASAAVAVLRKRHTVRQRAALRLASAEAVALCGQRAGAFRCAAAAPCGTGDCQLARGALAGLAVPAGTGPRGSGLSRPANHVAAGTRFSPDIMLGPLLEAEPWDAQITPLAIAV